MADKTWAQGSVAGEELEDSGDPTKCQIQDGARLQSNRNVNQTFAADGTVFTQGQNTGGRGKKWGLVFENIGVAKLQAIIANVNAAIDAKEGFQVTLEDDFHSIDAECTVDGTDWLSYPGQNTNSRTFGQVTMRFITK